MFTCLEKPRLWLVPVIQFLSIYLSGLVTAVAVFRNPNTIPFSLATDLLLNVLFSWLLVHLPPTFFLDVLFFFFFFPLGHSVPKNAKLEHFSKSRSVSVLW